mgnify:CR=1 FL=1
MKLSFRWYGPDDKVTLENIRQIPGMHSIVTAVYDVPVGEVWSEESIAALKKQVEELRGHGITRYCFTGRKECVMALRGRKRWDRSCQSLLEDLDFLLSRYEAQAADY